MAPECLPSVLLVGLADAQVNEVPKSSAALREHLSNFVLENLGEVIDGIVLEERHSNDFQQGPQSELFAFVCAQAFQVRVELHIAGVEQISWPQSDGEEEQLYHSHCLSWWKLLFDSMRS